jgi:16S rRNA (adenine1518-N6/adenine1519-N6)-dimethyltransferase
MSFKKKSLGQNFLRDKNIIDKIINLVQIKEKNIVEIGPGDGALTDQIIKLKPKNLILIEKDFKLFLQLKSKYKSKKFIKVICSDFLKINLENIIKNNTIVFGNLPYNISSQILIKLLKNYDLTNKYKDLILMFQKEVGEKIIAKYPSSKYGRLSIITSLILDLKEKFLVSPNCFTPKPKVQSLVLHFRSRRKKLANIIDISILEKVTNILFSNKRKMINKSLKKLLHYDEIKILKEIKMNERPSEIKPEIFYKIAEIIEKR